MKETIRNTVNKACIHTATLLVAVLVFIAFAASSPVKAASPMSSLEKIAQKVKNSEKYFKIVKKSVAPVNAAITEASPAVNTDQDKETDKDTAQDEGGENNGTDNTCEDNICGVDRDPEVMWNDKYTEAELRLMSGIIYCEAASMSEPARIAVANVIINRANSKTDWGHVNTIKEVIYDQKWGVQFSPIKGNPSTLDQALEIYDHLEDYKGNWKYDQMKNAISSAKKAFGGEKAIPDSFMYFNGSIESSKKKCEDRGRSYIVIDHHIYFE